MTVDREARSRALHELIAAVLRIGTLVAMALVAIGYGLALFLGAPSAGSVPLLELIGRDAHSTFMGLGLLGLALIPVIMLAVAAVTFASFGERRMVVTSAIVGLLLIGALVVAVMFGGVG